MHIIRKKNCVIVYKSVSPYVRIMTMKIGMISDDAVKVLLNYKIVF